jgi:hypothetical protein
MADDEETWTTVHPGTEPTARITVRPQRADQAAPAEEGWTTVGM